jgi:hypothetical protein
VVDHLLREVFIYTFSLSQLDCLPHTENGSYITPDGITVLVDEDIEAFLNGTLEFIYPSVGETS